MCVQCAFQLITITCIESIGKMSWTVTNDKPIDQFEFGCAFSIQIEISLEEDAISKYHLPASRFRIRSASHYGLELTICDIEEKKKERKKN